tara:strand:- start:253 stop:354 length:102 start_codon:yes stop_codon:yes gene_type:complete
MKKDKIAIVLVVVHNELKNIDFFNFIKGNQYYI